MKKRTVDNTMFYGAKPKIFERAKELRENLTEAEQKEYDLNRTFELEQFEIKVIRISNDTVFNNFQKVKNLIITECKNQKVELQSPL